MFKDFTDAVTGGHDLTWQDGANCKGANADLFFPERGARRARSSGSGAGCRSGNAVVSARNARSLQPAGLRSP
jgi:hypothetical protein